MDVLLLGPFSEYVGRLQIRANRDLRVERGDSARPAKLRSERTPATEATEPIEPIENAEPIEPIEQKDPIEPIEKELPIEPIEQNDPIEPIERAEPFEPRDRQDEVSRSIRLPRFDSKSISPASLRSSPPTLRCLKRTSTKTATPSALTSTIFCEVGRRVTEPN